MIPSPRIARAAAVLVLALAGLPLHAQAQCRPTTDSTLQSEPIDLPCFELRQLTPATVSALRDRLKKQEWEQALKLYFRWGYQPSLPDWVVYIDQNNTVYQAIVHDGKARNELSGKRYVWAVVFSDFRPAGTGAGLDTMDFRFSRRVIVHKRDPLISLLLKGFGKVVGIDAPGEETLSDSTRTLELRRINELLDTSPDLYAGYARFGLTENVEVELSLAPVRGKEFPDAAPQDTAKPPRWTQGQPKLQAVYANLANAKRRIWELGVLGGITYGPRIRTYNDALEVTDESPRSASNVYLVSVLNVPQWWWKVPFKEHEWQRASIGPFVATNLARGSILDEIGAGLAVGHVIGDAGLIGGWSWVEEESVEEGRVVKRRQPRWLLGVDVRF